MEPNEMYYLGKVTRTFGYKGEIVLYLDVDDTNDYLELDSVIIETKKEMIPFIITAKSFKHNNTVVVRLEDVDNEESARQLVNCKLYLPLAFLPKLSGNNFYYHEVIGFKVIDANYGEIGNLEKVLDYPNQDLLMVRQNFAEILIPINNDIIKNVDRSNREIHIQAPNGLIELYLK